MKRYLLSRFGPDGPICPKWATKAILDPFVSPFFCPLTDLGSSHRPSYLRSILYISFSSLFSWFLIPQFGGINVCHSTHTPPHPHPPLSSPFRPREISSLVDFQALQLRIWGELKKTIANFKQKIIIFKPDTKTYFGSNTFYSLFTVRDFYPPKTL